MRIRLPADRHFPHILYDKQCRLSIQKPVKIDIFLAFYILTQTGADNKVQCQPAAVFPTCPLSMTILPIPVRDIGFHAKISHFAALYPSHASPLFGFSSPPIS